MSLGLDAWMTQWGLKWELIPEQAQIITDVLRKNMLTQTDLIAQADPDEVLALTGMETLLMGAKIAFKTEMKNLKQQQQVLPLLHYCCTAIAAIVAEPTGQNGLLSAPLS